MLCSSHVYLHFENSVIERGELEMNSSRKTRSCLPNFSLRPMFVRCLPIWYTCKSYIC